MAGALQSGRGRRGRRAGALNWVYIERVECFWQLWGWRDGDDLGLEMAGGWVVVVGWLGQLEQG